MDLADFLGHWRFDRVILDAAGRETARVTGTATITGPRTEARYAEIGEMILPGRAPMTATRAYLWRADPGGIAAFFEDGRPFHLIRLTAPKTEAIHGCDPDDYRVAYDFSAWPDWTADWRVTGPRKDYRMVTRYERA